MKISGRFELYMAGGRDLTSRDLGPSATQMTDLLWDEHTCCVLNSVVLPRGPTLPARMSVSRGLEITE